MHHRTARLIALAWLPLAAWLALWPAVEARQLPMREMARQTVKVVRGGCCGARPAEGAALPRGNERHGCCRGQGEAPARVPACPDGGSARCQQCLNHGGPLLFTHVLSVPDPERRVLGALLHGDLVAASRDLRPPVPPPRSIGVPQYT